LSSTSDQEYLANFLDCFSRDVERFFAERVRERRGFGRVPVFCDDDFGIRLFWIPCNGHGFPRYGGRFDFATTDRPLSLHVGAEEALSLAPRISRVSLLIREPIIVRPDPLQLDSRPYVFLWRGELEDGSRERYASELTVRELLVLAQEKIKTRDQDIRSVASRNQPIA
jgi:hypothetical protein